MNLPLEEQALTVPSEPGNMIKTVEQLVMTAGTLETDDRQREILFAPPDDNLVQIRPDGMIYLPWKFYAERLNAAFGTMWSMFRSSKPELMDNLIIVEYFLFINGKFVAQAYGEQQYHQSNKLMTYGDALAGAKSNALTRLCKDLGMCLELWDKDYIDRWKKEYAISYTYHNNRKNEDETRWKKKKGYIEPQQEPDEEQEETKQPKGKFAAVVKLMQDIGWTKDDVASFCSQSFPLVSVQDGKPIFTWDEEGKLVMVTTANQLSGNQLQILEEHLTIMKNEFQENGQKPPVVPNVDHLSKACFAHAKEKNMPEANWKAKAYEMPLLQDGKPMMRSGTTEPVKVTSRSQLTAAQWVKLIEYIGR